MIRRRRSLVTGLAVTLVAGLLGMVPGTPPVSAAPKDNSPRLVEQTETADIYANGDGTNTAVFYAGPVNFFDKTAKEWRKVDNQFRRRNNRIENGAGPVQVQLPSEVSAADGIRIATDDWSVSFTFEGAKSKRPATIRNGRVRYDAIAPGMSLEYRMLSTGLKEDIVLDQPLPRDWPGYFRFRLSTSGVTPVAVDGDTAVSLQDARGQELARIPRGMMVDASRAMGAVDMKLGTDQAGWFVDVVPDSDFLTSPARTYPLRIDPEIDITVAGPTDTSDATVGNLGGSCTSCNWNSYFLWAGKSNGGADEFYSFLRFADMTRILDKTVSWSQLRLFATYEDDPSNLGWTAHLTKSTWNESTITWDRMVNPPYEGSHGPERIDIDANLQGGPDYYADTRDWAQAWANGQHGESINGKWSPYGITINTAGENAFFEFGSSESGDPNTVPALWVKYTNQTPNLPTGLSPTDGWTGTSTPQLSATLNDPDDNDGWIEFDIDSAITAVVPTTNGTVSWTPTLGSGTHSWRARGRDFDTAGPWTALRYFTINNAPYVPDQLSPEDRWFSAATPTLAARYRDDDGGTGTLRFEITGQGGGTFEVPTTAGSIASCRPGIECPQLADGVYSWRVQATDNITSSAWTTAQTFTVENGLVFHDNFTVGDGNSWLGSKWLTNATGTAQVALVNGEGQLYVPSGTDARAQVSSMSISDASVLMTYRFQDRLSKSDLRVTLRANSGTSLSPNSGYRVRIMSDSKTIKLYRVTNGTPVNVGSFDYTKDTLAQNLRFTVEGDLVIVTAWQVGTPEPQAAIVYQDPDPLPAGSLNFVHNGTTATRSIYVDDVAVTDLAIVHAAWPFPTPLEARPGINEYSRHLRTLDTTAGTTTMNVQGYIPDDAITMGAPCVSQSGNHRPECTAQAQAIRKLNDLMNGGFVPGDPPYDTVQWEVGPDGNNFGCLGNPNISEETHDDCEPLDASNFRVDIVTANGEGTSASEYRLVEVKRWSNAAPGAVRTQLNTYRDHMLAAGLRIDFEDRLNGAAWVVSYFDNNGEQWFAWAPVESDNEGSGGFNYPQGMRYVGEVYFETAANTPDPVKNRWNSHKTMADRDWQYLRWYTFYVIVEYLRSRNPYQIPLVPVQCCF